ncbi:hypothetical protein DL98DRAFT_604685, partial [Cadophora sp. DSE1049]
LPKEEVITQITSKLRGSYKPKFVPLSEKSTRTQERALANQRELERQKSKFKTSVAIKSTTQQTLGSFFKLKEGFQAKSTTEDQFDEELYEDIESNNENTAFDQQIEEELNTEDLSIELANLYDTDYLQFDSGRQELLLDSLLSEAISPSVSTSRQSTYREVLSSIKAQLSDKRARILPRLRFDLYLTQQYLQVLLKKSPRRGRIEASLLVAESNHPIGDGITLARKIRAMFLYYRTHGSLPLETRGGRRANRSYLDNEDFRACRTWLLAQKIATVTPKKFRYALNTEIIPRLLANTKNLFSANQRKAKVQRLGRLLVDRLLIRG